MGNIFDALFSKLSIIPIPCILMVFFIDITIKNTISIHGIGMQTLSKQDQLNALYDQYRACTACPLGFAGRTQVVFGRGNPEASLVIIGEGPGRDEDLQGKPFVGRSGKLLNLVLEQNGIGQDQIYITNIVKCRPPENRAPFPIESATCKNLLLFKQLQIIKPAIICTLGSVAIRELLERPVAITKERGQLLKINNTFIVPTYHPAYILRNNSQLENFFLDIKKVAEFLRK